MLLLLLHLLQRCEGIRQRLGLHFCHGALCRCLTCGNHSYTLVAACAFAFLVNEPQAMINTKTQEIASRLRGRVLSTRDMMSHQRLLRSNTLWCRCLPRAEVVVNFALLVIGFLLGTGIHTWTGSMWGLTTHVQVRYETKRPSTACHATLETCMLSREQGGNHPAGFCEALPYAEEPLGP